MIRQLDVIKPLDRGWSVNDTAVYTIQSQRDYQRSDSAGFVIFLMDLQINLSGCQRGTLNAHI